MMIKIYNSQKDLPVSVSSIRKAISSLLNSLSIVTDELILHLVSETVICQIHQEFFQDPSSTDCISFPVDPPNQDFFPNTQSHILGEIFVCPKVAVEYAKKRGKDPYEETLLYLIHGLLHLIGYDDLTPSDRKKMRQMEKKCLSLLPPLSLTPPLSSTLKIKSSKKILS